MAKTTSIINLLTEIKYQEMDSLNIFKKYRINDTYMNNTSFYEEYIIRENDRWDILGDRFYGTSELWWLIPLSNKIQDPFSSLSVGKTLKILKKSILTHLLSELRKEK